MKRMKSVLVLLSAAALATVSQAAVIASWDFEIINGVAATDNQTLNGGDVVVFGDGDSFDDASGNGNLLNNYASNYTVSQNIGGNTTLAGWKATSWDGLWTDGDLELGGIAVGALAQWSVEADVYFNSVSGWQTLVGKDGRGVGGDSNAAAFYLQNNGIDNKFRFNFATTSGDRYVIDGTTAAVAQTWYTVKAVSDGSTAYLYVNGVLENSVDISASLDSSLVALQVGEVEGTSGPAYSWSVGRGMYNDRHGDRLNGYIDNVVITSVPEPVTIVLLGMGGFMMLRKRK